MDNPLTKGDLNSLFADYYQYRSKWKFIGNALGIKMGDLKAINRTHRGDCDDCFLEVLATWLEQVEPEVKTEGQLRQAAEKSLSQPLAPAAGVTEKTNRRIWISAVLVPMILALLASYFRASPSQILREKYQKQPLMESTLLNYAIPFLNVTMVKTEVKTSRHSTLTLSDFIAQIGDEKRTLITGHPGAGKTTLMRYLAREWAEERALLLCQILFLIQLDTLPKEHKPLSLSDLLQMSSYKDIGDVIQMSKEIQNSHGAGVCFLLDAYDQWHLKGDFVYNLFFQNELHDSICILASRPNFYQERESINVFEIVGFRQTDLEQFLHSMTTDEAVICSVSDLWSADPNVKEMCRLPLNMVMVVFLAIHHKMLSVHTKTQIYFAFMTVKVKHFQNQRDDMILDLTECIKGKASAGDEPLCAAFQHLHRAAYEMHFERKETFPEDLKIKHNLNKLGFVSIITADAGLDRVNEVKYKFFHPTFMEFFAAIHLLSLSQGDRLSLYIKEQSERQINHNLWLFFFGLVGKLYDSHEHFFPDNIPDVLRQFAMYHSEQEIEQSPPYCQNGRFLEYIKEIQWKGKKLSKLLSSAGIIVNSTLSILCGDKPCSSLSSLVFASNEEYMSIYSLLYIVNNTDIHTLMFDNLGGTNCEIDALQLLQANILVLVHNLLDVLQVNKLEFVKVIFPLIFNSIMSLQDSSPSEMNRWLMEVGISIMNLSDKFNINLQNVSMETNLNLSQNVPVKLLVQSMSEVVSDQYSVAFQSQNNASKNLFTSTIMDKFSIVMLVTVNAIANCWEEKFLLEVDNMSQMYSAMNLYSLTQLNVSDSFSVYIHMTLQEQTDPHDKTVKWSNADNIVDYILSGNILSNIFWEFMNKRSDSIVEQVLSAVLNFQHNVETEAKSMLLETFESMFLTTAEFWESVKSLLSRLRSIHLENVELSCDDYVKLVERLKCNKNTIYTFNLKIDLGSMTQNVSASCYRLVSFLSPLTGHNIKLQKLTLIFPTEYFISRHEKFIPHNLKSSGLKHISIILPKLLEKRQCSQLIRELSGFNQLVTLEIYGCPLHQSKIMTLLPHTLKEITLAQSNLTNEDASGLVKLVNSTSKLMSLSLPNNFITGNSLKDLVGVLKTHDEFISLDLSGNLIKENNGLGLLSHLRNLRELKLSSCSMGNTEIEELVSVLESNLNLRSLNLSGNPFIGTEHGLEPLARLTNLQYLDISNRLHFDINGYCEGTLIKVLKSLTQLQFLNLCSKTDPPIYWSKDMAAALSSLPHLQVFNAPCLRLRED